MRYFLFFLFFLVQILRGQEIIRLNSENDFLFTGKKMGIFEDTGTRLQINQILSPDIIKLFKTGKSEIPNFNVSASAIWSRLLITTDINERWMLEVGNPNAESVKCYLIKRKKIIDSVEFGIHSQNSGKALNTYHGYYDLKLFAGDTVEVYVRWTERSPLHVKLCLGTISGFFERDHFTNFFHGMIYGIILLMIFYNSFLVLTGGGREYLYYVIYILFNLLFLIYFTGHVSLLPLFFRNVLYVHPVVIPAIFGTFGALFTMEFLQTSTQMPFMHKLMKFNIAFAFLNIIISLFKYYHVALFLLQINGLSLSVVSMTAGIISLRQRNKYAKYYLFGYGAYLFALFLFIGSDFEIFPFLKQGVYILEAGAIAEAVMLSFAIGEKFNSANRDRSVAQERALSVSMENERIIREQNILLEEKVQERTLQLQKTNFIIEEKNRDILDSIRYAERIQRSFLATREILGEHLRDYFIFFRPKDVVSGDFYWASKLINGNFVFVTADSTGHGVPGAIMSLLNTTSLEKATETLTEPADILNATRKIIIERLKKDGSTDGGKDGMDASIIVLNIERNKLIYAAANNPVWIVRCTDSSVASGESAILIEAKPDKMPVGKHDKDEVPFSQSEMELQKGDMIYLLTDGMPDQFGGPHGKKYKYKQLKELLLSIAYLPTNDQRIQIVNSLRNWMGNLEQVDDITVVGIRV